VCASRTGKNNVYLLLAFIAIAQQQGGAHAGLEVAQAAFCCMHVLLHQFLQMPQQVSVISDVSGYTTSRPSGCCIGTYSGMLYSLLDFNQTLELQAK